MAGLIRLFATLGVRFTTTLAKLFGKSNVATTISNLALIGATTVGAWVGSAFNWVTGDDDATEDIGSTMQFFFSIIGGLLVALVLVIIYKPLKKMIR